MSKNNYTLLYIVSSCVHLLSQMFLKIISHDVWSPVTITPRRESESESGGQRMRLNVTGIKLYNIQPCP